MAASSAFTPKASLCDAPTNLKEAIDWVLRVTGKDGKELNKETECICGLAAAVTDLLQSVQLDYHGYQGDDKISTKKEDVDKHLNELFSLVQGLGGTAVVRTYIDQLAQVLSALVGWSKIEQCKGTSQKDHGSSACTNGGNGDKKCQYLGDIKPENKCNDCGCIKVEKDKYHLGRGCTRCKDSGGSSDCQCDKSGGSCSTDKECQCAKKGKCCKCYCKEECKKECQKYSLGGDKECICKNAEDSYRSAYPSESYEKRVSFLVANRIDGKTYWRHVTSSRNRHQCARILLGSVCLIWSGVTYMYWTGRRAHNKTSPYWNNHILDGSGLDDGTLSQWLQALGFPRDMLNNHGPENRLDNVITDEFMHKFYLGFADTSGGNNGHGQDKDDNTFRSPAGYNVGGFIHAINKGAFGGSVFPKESNGTDKNIDKLGPIYKLYILSCAYFTGLQKKNADSVAANTTTNNPKTIREILYWLSALPYSPAYKEMLNHAKKELDKVAPEDKKLSFKQQGRWHPITVEEVNLYAHFQAVTQYCPLVLIGIQGGIHSTKGTDNTKEPPIHSLYANTECNFTYPAVDIQAYNQVVHYIRALFYQLYFLRKQCAVKVTCGGKWRECRYGNGVVSKGVVSWMCLGCSPMEHDRKWRVTKMEKKLDGVHSGDAGTVSTAIKDLLVPLGRVVVALGNAQEALERGKEKDHIYQSMVIGLVGALEGVVGAVKKVVEKGSTSLGQLKEALGKVIDVVLVVVTKLQEGVNGKNKGSGVDNAKAALQEVKGKLEGAQQALTEAKKDLGNGKLEEAKKELDKLSTKGGSGSLQAMWKALRGLDENGKAQSLPMFIEVSSGKLQVDAGKNRVSEFIHKVRDAMDALKELAEENVKGNGNAKYYNQTRIQVIIPAIENLLDIVGSTRCVHCRDHANKCGRQGEQKTCDKCHQQYMDGTPSPLQAFLEDRLPGFSCANTKESLDKQEAEKAEKGEKDTVTASELNYPSAADHLHHTNSPGQCCPLPMGFRNAFYNGSASDCTGQRLFGILYFFSNENMMQSCVYRLVRVTSALSATTPQVLGDVFGFFRGGVGSPEQGEDKSKGPCNHEGIPGDSKHKDKYFCGWCASGLRDEVQKIEWIPKGSDAGGHYMEKVGKALIGIKGDKDSAQQPASQSTTTTTPSALSALTKDSEYLSPLTGELYTAVSATFGHVYLQWVLYLSDALQWGLYSLSEAFRNIECRGCRGCDPNKCRKGAHGDNGDAQCRCQSIVSCTGVLPVLYRHGFSYGNPFNLEGFHQRDGKTEGDYSITENKGKDNKIVTRRCHEFLDSLSAVIQNKQATSQDHPLTNLLSQVGQLQYDIRLPWIFVLTVAWLVAVLYLAFGAIWPLDWTHMRSHWLRGGEHQWQCMWYKVMTGRKGVELMEYFGKRV